MSKAKAKQPKRVKAWVVAWGDSTGRSSTSAVRTSGSQPGLGLTPEDCLRAVLRKVGVR